MEKAGWTELALKAGSKRVVSLEFVLCGLLLGALFVVPVAGCKGSSTDEKVSAPQEEMSIPEYWRSLFKNDPEALKEFDRIQTEFRTGKQSAGFQDLEALLKRSPQAPWAEAVDFYLAEALTVLRQYGNALARLDSLLARYPTSPAVPRYLISKGKICMALGKQSNLQGGQGTGGEEYLKKAKEIFLQVSKDYRKNTRVAAEALFYLGEVSLSLKEPAGAREAFEKVAEAYGDTPFGGKSLYALAGLELSDADLEGAEKAFREITRRYPKTRLAGKAQQKLEGLELVGKKAPPLQIKEWIGGPPPQGDLYRGKLTLLSFWAFWCPHCRRNIPKMEQLLETYGPKGVSILGVTRAKEGQGVEKIKEFIKDHPMGFPTGVDDDGKTSLAMAVKSIPCIVAVDSRGRIRWHGHPDHLSAKVMEFLLRSSP